MASISELLARRLAPCSPVRAKPTPICAPTPDVDRIGTRAVAVWPFWPLIVTVVRYSIPAPLLPSLV